MPLSYSLAKASFSDRNGPPVVGFLSMYLPGVI